PRTAAEYARSAHGQLPQTARESLMDRPSDEPNPHESAPESTLFALTPDARSARFAHCWTSP
ncbi:MAG TPA: hypothetical protein VMD98_05010, partial [Bryocella sp.]|nr:hypothetical protein [Bryocella sp.]